MSRCTTGSFRLGICCNDVTVMAHDRHVNRADHDLDDMWALQGRSAMHLACLPLLVECKGQCEIVQMLVAHGADINAKDDVVCGALFDMHAMFIDTVVTLQLPQCIQCNMHWMHSPAGYCTGSLKHLSCCEHAMYLWC